MLNTVDLRFDQRTANDGFLVNALRAIYRGSCVSCHLLRSDGQFIHRGRNQFDLLTLVRYSLATFIGNDFNSSGLAFDLSDRLPDPLNQLMNLADCAIDNFTKLTQFVLALRPHLDCHIPGGHIIHH
ncbi:hypothetical protein D9M71_683490 [compost metagenome]